MISKKIKTILALNALLIGTASYAATTTMSFFVTSAGPWMKTACRLTVEETKLPD